MTASKPQTPPGATTSESASGIVAGGAAYGAPHPPASQHPSQPPSGSLPRSPRYGVYAAGDALAGRFEIISLIATGGMGTVYRARDIELDDIVALKVLRRDLDLGPALLDRFRREVKLARRIGHPNVARMFDIYEHEQDRFLAMELIEGEALSTLIARDGPQPLERGLAIAIGICEGLSAAHAASVVHRDLKPENVLIERGGRVVLTDFGIARPLYESLAAHSVGLSLGTPAYMAPEQLDGSEIDARADLYALGTLLFEVFTGKRPWTGDSPFAVAGARLLAEPPDPRSLRPDMPASCAEVILQCMARRPADRFASAEEVKTHFVALRSELRPPSSGPTSRIPSSLLVPAPPPLPVPAPPISPVSIPTPPSPSSLPQSSMHALAVLPFQNTGSPDDQYLADELTDELIDGLSATSGLRVRPRGAVQKLDTKDANPADVGVALGVETIIQGSIRRSADRVRITARLIQVSDGFQVWAKRYDRPTSEILEINDDLARAVASALGVGKDDPSCCAPESKAPRTAAMSPEALDLFLRGRHELRKLWPANLTRAIALFEQAEALATDVPLLLAAKAAALSRRWSFVGAGLTEARAAAERAVELAPTLVEAHHALANILIQQGDAADGVRSLLRVLDLQPAFSDAHASLGRLLTETELIGDGIRHLTIALTFDVDHPVATSALGRAYALKRDFEKAFEVIERHRSRTGRGYHEGALARIILWKRDREQAERMLATLSTDDDGARIAKLMLLVAARDDISMLLQAEGSPKPRPFLQQLSVECRAAVGDAEGALNAVERYAATDMIDSTWLDRCPLFDELRSAPRFVAARDKVAARSSKVAATFKATRTASSAT